MTEETNVQEQHEEVETIEAVESTETAEAVEAVEAADAADAVEEADANQDSLTEFAAIKQGDTVTGQIVKLEDHLAYVSIGYKYDGIIPIRELSALPVDDPSEVVEVGQQVECKVVSIDDEKERLVLSKRQVDSVKAWDELEQHFNQQDIIETTVANVVKGGLVVDLGVRGFVPASMIERHYVEDFSDYKGKTVRLKVKEIDRENNKLILSQKEVLDEEYEQLKQQIISNLRVDQVIEGAVQRLTPFGVFVDVGGIDGLVHISELAWNHVEHPSEVVKEGDIVNVKVLKIDPQTEKISLSIKAAQPGPWDQVTSLFKVGDIVTGTVKRLVSFGAFVEIAPGIEGLTHISQISHKHIGTPHEVLKEGQQVNVKVLDVNPADKRVSLSIKETEEAPEQPARTTERARGGKSDWEAESAALSNQGLNLTLGERFGDKLSKFK